MMAFCEKHAFNWIIPDVNEGESVEGFKKTLVELSNSQCDMNDVVFIFDTLKKFVNTMSKTWASSTVTCLLDTVKKTCHER
jgi:hypothetical protein